MTTGNGSILVTGGAGYIGSHIALDLLAAGRRVVVLDDLSEGSRRLVPEAAAFVHGRVGDETLAAEVMRDHGVEAVVHCAGSIRVPESVTDPLKYYENNVSQSLGLIRACVAAGVGAFVFSSTAAVYGLVGREPVGEQAPCVPFTPYGASKLMVERMLEDAAAAGLIRHVAMRYFNVAGADPQGRSGLVSRESSNLIKVACEVAVGRRDGMEIFGTDYDTRDGTAIRDFIHVSDLAAAHAAALRYLAGGGAPLVVNCGYGRGVTVREVIEGMGALRGAPLPVRTAPRRQGDAPEVVADAGLIRRVLDWRPRHDSLEAMLGSALAWERTL